MEEKEKNAEKKNGKGVEQGFLSPGFGEEVECFLNKSRTNEEERDLLKKGVEKESEAELSFRHLDCPPYKRRKKQVKVKRKRRNWIIAKMSRMRVLKWPI